MNDLGYPRTQWTGMAERLLWAKEPGTTVAASLPATQGGGRILFAQLDLQRRVDPAKPYYDPAAERLFLILLGADVRR
jgi:hypothetical protein